VVAHGIYLRFADWINSTLKSLNLTLSDGNAFIPWFARLDDMPDKGYQTALHDHLISESPIAETANKQKNVVSYVLVTHNARQAHVNVILRPQRDDEQLGPNA
jgi:hypothetical protein